VDPLLQALRRSLRESLTASAGLHLSLPVNWRAYHEARLRILPGDMEGELSFLDPFYLTTHAIPAV